MNTNYVKIELYLIDELNEPKYIIIQKIHNYEWERGVISEKKFVFIPLCIIQI